MGTAGGQDTVGAAQIRPTACSTKTVSLADSIALRGLSTVFEFGNGTTKSDSGDLGSILAKAFINRSKSSELFSGDITGVLLRDDNVMIPEEVTREEAFGAMVVNFLRGLSTVKGLQVIDEMLSKEPRPKTLKQRREEAEKEKVNENN